MKTKEQAREELGLPLDALVIGAVLRLEAVKGVDDLLRAFARVEVKHPIWLAIVGDGTEREPLLALAKKLGIAHRVFWAGQRHQAFKLLPAFDLFVQPSRHEGMPNAVLEAMASALPIVATAVGGTSEAVVDGESGLLVPAGDLESMASAITRLLDDAELRHRMGQIGRERVKDLFSVEQMVHKTECLYTSMLQKKGLFHG
jgi:glycosyltransferase involved in cell wall biosynthesis